LLLPEKTPENFERKYQNIASEKPKIQYFEFDPNTLDTNGWQKLGFSEKQAIVIVNYRERNLKGSFKSLEDIKKCFVISEEKFNELKPYIKLNLTQKTSENAAQNLPEKAKPTTDFSKTDLNKITFQQLIEFGFDEKSAASFIGFRNKLGGFVKSSQILETYNIDKNLAEKLINVSPLNNMNVQKFSLLDAPEDWLKNHPYFRYYANKIIYYRISFPKESTIFEKMKAKPEDEAKMRLYLK
jgi:DNA uptake protein ComE-like DNA-binding protein